MTEPQRTHFADDATLAHIARLERELSELAAERIQQATKLRQFRDMLEDESDVTDRPDGDGVRPNAAMRFLDELDTLFPELSK